jgi:hypothetical protein
LNEQDEPDTDHERGKKSQQGFAEDDRERPIKDTRQQPNLAEPAEREMNPPTHPTRDDGLGQKSNTDPSGARPVPPGDPNNESDRSDVQ